MRPLDELRDIALTAALAGGALIKAAFDSGIAATPEVKGLGDYVTATDRAAEDAVLGVLRARTPEMAILAEETAAIAAMTDEPTWAVDPLDGTTNFVRGYTPAVAVSVGLMVAGEPVVGAVVSPAIGGAWCGARGLGAHDARGRRLAVRHNGIGAGVAVTGLPFRKPENRARYLPILDAAISAFEDIRRNGSASLDCTYVAQGTWDGYFELGLSLWDIAAGALLVREAGGVVTDWTGDQRALFQSGDILAGSPVWHEQMLELVRGAR